MAPRLLAPGTVLSGRYQLAEVIGESDLSTPFTRPPTSADTRKSPSKCSTAR